MKMNSFQTNTHSHRSFVESLVLNSWPLFGGTTGPVVTPTKPALLRRHTAVNLGLLDKYSIFHVGAPQATETETSLCSTCEATPLPPETESQYMCFCL